MDTPLRAVDQDLFRNWTGGKVRSLSKLEHIDHIPEPYYCPLVRKTNAPTRLGSAKGAQEPGGLCGD